MQINRLFEIVYILLDKKRITAGELAKEFEVSTRTIYRDVETLSSAGIPIYMSKGKGGGIFLMEDFVLNKAVFTDDEKSDILSAMKAVSSVSLGERTTASEKLASLFGNQNTDWIEVDFSSWVNWEDETKTFNLIKASIVEKKQVEFTYSGGGGQTNHRIVEPLKLVYKAHAWYLYGYCGAKQDYRLFKLRRIRDIVKTDDNVTKLAPINVFTKEDCFNDNMVTVTLKLKKEVAYRVYDEFKNYQQQEDGSFIATINMPDGKWVYSYVSSFGEYCEVIKPEEIRKGVIEQIHKTLENYERINP